MFVVFDLDSTLADIEHRLPFIQKEPKNWDAFNEACHLDGPIVEIAAVLWALHEAGEEIEIWSGRSESVREKTERWLKGLGIYPRKLLMRPVGDHCQDDDLKERWLKESPKKPDLVFEDRKRVVEMYRSHGIMCVQVASGDY